MKVYSTDGFLARGSQPLPQGEWRGIAIHPSSDVDLISVDGYQVGPGGVHPLHGGGAGTISAVRRSTSVGSNYGESTPLERLVYVMYEHCDALVPVGPRIPKSYRAQKPATVIDVLPAQAELALVVPFYGRKHATLSFRRSDSANDLSVQVIGRRAGMVDQPRHLEATANAAETWWNGGGAAPTDAFGNVMGRTVHIGGAGDSEESFDDLVFLVYGTTGAAGSLYTLTVEVDGERAGS